MTHRPGNDRQTSGDAQIPAAVCITFLKEASGLPEGSSCWFWTELWQVEKELGLLGKAPYGCQKASSVSPNSDGGTS